MNTEPSDSNAQPVKTINEIGLPAKDDHDLLMIYDITDPLPSYFLKHEINEIRQNFCYAVEPLPNANVEQRIAQSIGRSTYYLILLSKKLINRSYYQSCLDDILSEEGISERLIIVLYRMSMAEFDSLSPQHRLAAYHNRVINSNNKVWAIVAEEVIQSLKKLIIGI